jgi:hypothetical protein
MGQSEYWSQGRQIVAKLPDWGMTKGSYQPESYQPESYDFGELCSNHAHFPQRPHPTS